MIHSPAVTDFAVTTNFNAELYELVMPVRKFDQTHTSASAPTDCHSTGVGADIHQAYAEAENENPHTPTWEDFLLAN